MGSPHHERKRSSYLRTAFQSELGYEANEMIGESISINTTLEEGADRAILSINSLGEPIASCYVTRADLVRIKKEFGLIERAKSGRHPLQGAKHRQLQRALKRHGHT